MVARSMPVGIKPHPKPKSDEERLRELRDAQERHYKGLTKVIAEIAIIEAKRNKAA